MSSAFQIQVSSEAPLAAAAIHDGHHLRAEVADAIALTDAERLREEDPFTARWTGVVGTRLIAQRSRFEVDLNRPRHQAVYRTPAEAWGLQVWQEPLAAELLQRSLAVYDAFYSAARTALSALQSRWGRFVVLDLHSYNHRRNGPDAPPADPVANPEVNVGTGSLDRERWSPVVDRFIDGLRRVDYFGRTLDVRENVRFRGGHFAAWVHETYPGTGCALAIEVKKFFMDEWTGQADAEQVEAISRALASTLPDLRDALDEMA